MIWSLIEDVVLARLMELDGENVTVRGLDSKKSRY